MADELARVMQAETFCAERLIRTETNYFSNQDELEAYKESGLERYRFLATLDAVTSKLCQAHDGTVDPDTKEPYYVKDAAAGVNYPPLHAFCRSTTVIVIDGDDKTALRTRRAKDPVTGEYYQVPQDMTYKEWYAKYVEGNAEAEASFKAAGNKSADERQFEKYREILGKDSPKTFENFQNIKYTDKELYSRMNAYTNAVSHGYLSPQAGTD